MRFEIMRGTDNEIIKYALSSKVPVSQEHS